MLSFVIRFVVCCTMLVLFPSCIKYYKVIKNEFPQGEKRKDRREVAYNFLRTSKVYDQFVTQAIFHTLWLSNDVRAAYIDDFSGRRGKQADARDALLKRQLEENRHWISFYVLADLRNRQHVALNDKNAFWTMYIETQDGKKIEPISIKNVDLEPEYQRYFGHRYTPYKDMYLVRFPAKSLNGKKYLKKDDDSFKLMISSPYKKLAVEWQKKNRRKHVELLKDEDFYWG